MGLLENLNGIWGLYSGNVNFLILMATWWLCENAFICRKYTVKVFKGDGTLGQHLSLEGVQEKKFLLLYLQLFCTVETFKIKNKRIVKKTWEGEAMRQGWLYHTALISNTSAWLWYMDRHTSVKEENPELHEVMSQITDKMNSLTNDWNNRTAIWKKINLDPYLFLYTKTNSTWIIASNAKKNKTL